MREVTSSVPGPVLGLSPFGVPDPLLVAAVSRGGGLGVLDLGGPAAGAAEGLRRIADGTPFAVRVPPGCTLRPEDVLRPGLRAVLLGWNSPWTPEQAGVPVLAEVTSLDEAHRAAASGAHGLVARGAEAGGRVGELTTFVLLQQLLAEVDLPVWACGGIGPRTAAAAVAGGAAGVLLDTQLALLPDTDAPRRLRELLRRADGSEPVLVAGHRVLPDESGIERTEPEMAVAAGTGQVVPLGRDAPLAALFESTFDSAELAVRSLVHELGSGAVGTTGTGPIEQGAPLRRTLGTDLAVAQGPMTRVSDQPGFAAEVAAHGGLPFVAVALADGRRTAELLGRTAELLGDRPWGAGILGFVPEELRAEQLEAVRRARPRSVLIAGGRPAQAKALEAEGIATYLHVPSPILLRQFLDAGVRRFVFEGAECGGHIGPRSSFALWEAQLDVLRRFSEEHPRETGIELFFAGGIHDARSAAMVSAMAAPLAARGVGIGVLMGTAYLFTEEAVRHGAITELFQRQAVDARSTATLETAPGHLTRCLDSPFVDEFRSIERTLRERGVPAQERWQRLEELNTGRLRIASKGLRREGAELRAVDEAGQLADGMYMAGQVAVLREATTDLATLHRAVTEDAERLLAARRPAAIREHPGPAPADIAIVGMACLFPGAEDLPSFWSNVLRGVDSVTEVPAERWDPAVYYREGTAPPGSTPSKWGGFLADIPFDPMSFGIPPASMGSIDPAQLLSLEVARRALDDAGYRTRPFGRDRTGVVFGAEAGGDLANAGVLAALLPAYLEHVPPELAEQLPALTEDSFPGTLANVISGRIANRLDLGGTNYTVDAACGSSLAALDLACKELVQGSSDLMLCGAVDLHNGINDYLMFASAGALSPTGRCRPFDTAADGIALGEGVACLALKRLADAERDGDRVYAVIKGVGAASDGKARGLTAPRPEGQRRALARAYRGAGLSPSSVGLVEAHGTGTVVGDGTELTTLTEFFLAEGATAGGCALGSVKSQIGHTKCAAGLAGVIKAALAVWTGVLPPTAQLRTPNAAWDQATSPFTFGTAARPWLAPERERVAGVSAFGFGGTNFHAVLAAGPSPAAHRHGLRDWDCELFLFRGKDSAAAKRQMTWLLELAEVENGTLPLRSLAATASGRESGDPVRFAVVAADREELVTALRAAGSGGAPDRRTWFAAGEDEPGKLAFLFPGQGSQRTGMLAELFTTFPESRSVLDLDPGTASAVFPATAFDPAVAAGQEDDLRDTRVAQPALGLVSSALFRVLDRLEVRPDLLGGHSYGELVALAAADAFDLPALIRLSGRRAAAILGATGDDPGAMAAVKATPERVAAALGDAPEVVLANHNAPEQVVLSGATDAIERAVESLRAQRISAKRIPVACAFHSPLVAAGAAGFAEALAAETVRPPRLPVWSNRTARRYQPDGVREELTAQLGSAVRFAEQIEDMYAAGARTFLEVGPGRVLTGLVGSVLGDRPHRAIACDDRPGGGRTGLRNLLTALAGLATAGVDVRTEWLFRGRAVAVPATSATPVSAPGWTVNGHLVRRLDGTPPPNGLRPANRIPRSTMTDSRPADSGGHETSDVSTVESDKVVLEFLRSNREVVAAQREVLLKYFGSAQARPPAVTPAPAASPAPVELPSPAPVAAPEAQPEPQVVDVLRAVIEVISDRTGYPAEMIDGDLDLEADLSVDSIKRTEIAGTLIAKLGLRDRLDDTEQDELSRKRTANAAAEWIEKHLAPEPAAAETGESAVPPETPATAETVRTPRVTETAPEPSAAAYAPERFVLRQVPAASGHRAELRGRTVLLLSEPGQDELVASLTTELARHGARTVFRSDSGFPAADLLLCLGPLRDSDEPAAPQLFGTLRDAARAGAGALVVAAAAGRPHVAGLRGLIRAVAREHDGRAKLVELPEANLVANLVRELQEAEPLPVVCYSGGDRTTFELTAEGLGSAALSGAGPAGPGAAEAQAIGLDRESVLLLIGGARGITARFAGALATAAGCRIELAGRTPFAGEPEDPATRELTDPHALRRALAAGGGSIADVERQVRTILAEREIAATCEEIRLAGGQPGYHCVDVRDGAALQQLVKDVHARYGRLDGIVHAAGVIDDKLMSEKDDGSFRTVFGTKVDGAVSLLDALSQVGARPRFVTFFGSIAAVLGNRGQTDYAAANDALENLGAGWAAATGNRALTVHWGPWAPSGTHGGMVSEELAREYGRRDMRLIDPEEGTTALLRELAYGPRTHTSVVYTASLW
ncbi:type I polyketide synthase [Amycolatopsis nigrescens]|uniref:type I polyketide synthase n=1 Tax=Amycolatopsis nigrescens TaxID=381445 RepID=UPI0003605A55|nr:type I polyketide synthase [Amycolatopsis nigrescens]